MAKKNNGQELVPSPSKLEIAEQELAPFLALNSGAKIEVSKARKPRLFISKPWGDDSIIITIPEDIPTFAAALNNLFLPERYSAIWHKDTRDFEIIFTAFEMPDVWKDIPGRVFALKDGRNEFKCEFGQSSERLMTIAENSKPISLGVTQGRNLYSYYLYSRRASGDENGAASGPIYGTPTSFWIRGVDWNEDKVLRLVLNLNFYLSYYDTRSPLIMLHSPKKESIITQPQTRYGFGPFPETIRARPIDENLLYFWLMSRSGDPAQRFLYCYRIIEYQAYSYVEEDIRKRVKKIATSPHFQDGSDILVDHLISEVQASRLTDPQRFDLLVKDMVDPGLLWREISKNLHAFTTETKFDGRCHIEPLADKDMNEHTFVKSKGLDKFTKAARDIRNALSHGKDTKQAVITPTAKNFEKLQPWVSLMSVAAGEAIVYRHSV